MHSIIILLGAHFLGDYVFQQAPLFQLKNVYWEILILHTLIWSTCICAALVLIKRFSGWKFLFLFITHSLIDYTKLYFYPHPTPIVVMAVDQVAHFLQLYIVSKKKLDLFH